MNISLLAALLLHPPYFFTSSSTGNSTGNSIAFLYSGDVWAN
jgi:hypothetical protein